MKVGIVGAGFMGAGIAGTAVLNVEVDTRLKDADLARGAQSRVGAADARGRVPSHRQNPPHGGDAHLITELCEPLANLLHPGAMSGLEHGGALERRARPHRPESPLEDWGGLTCAVIREAIDKRSQTQSAQTLNCAIELDPLAHLRQRTQHLIKARMERR